MLVLHDQTHLEAHIGLPQLLYLVAVGAFLLHGFEQQPLFLTSYQWCSANLSRLFIHLFVCHIWKCK